MKSTSSEKIWNVYILAGQSNMDGLGLVSELPEALLGIQKNVWIYNPNRRDDQQNIDDTGFWEILREGHGSGFATDGSQSYYSDKFGIELSFAKSLQELDSSQNILLIKYAKGGASIHQDAGAEWGSWTPDYTLGNGINQWTHFEHHYRRAISQFDENSILIPSGILWLQGESDASHTKGIADDYLSNLQNLISRMRDLTGNQRIPVVIAQISESNLAEGSTNKVLRWGEIIQRAQLDFVLQDSNAAIIYPPLEIGWLDPWHYDSKTYVKLGERFALAIHKLQNDNSELKGKNEHQ
jgi:hypothetical protein